MFRSLYLRLVFLKIWLERRDLIYRGWSVIYSFKGSTIKIGSGTSLFSSFTSNMLGLYQRCIIVARYGGYIELGQKCGISGSTIYAWDSIKIGNHTCIGANCKIIDNDFHPLSYSQRINIEQKYKVKKRPIIIGECCFIGANSIILKGTTLGKNVVVGAGSVVCGTFPDNVIIAGNPAKIVKENK